MRLPAILGRGSLWQVLLVLLIILDLGQLARGLYERQDPSLLEHRPPAVEFLSRDKSIWRMTTFDPADRKTFNANSPWLFGFHDIRGYDSLFSSEYAAYMDAIGPQDQFDYNRVSPLRTTTTLDSPLLDLLNVKYVVTEEHIESPRWILAHEDDAVRIYRNREALPRAFLLPFTATAIAQDPIDKMRRLDPRNYVIVKADLHPAGIAPDFEATRAINRAASISRYEDSRVDVEARVEERSWLVLADSYDAGWTALGRNLDTGAAQVELELYPVNGILRGVPLDPGNWVVSFRYRPPAFLAGVAMSVLGGIALLLLILVHIRENRMVGRQPAAAT